MENNIKDKLINEIHNNRDGMYEMLKDVVDLRTKLKNLFPDKVDYRNRFYMEEKMKSVSSVLTSEIQIRKLIDDSVKNEFGLIEKKEKVNDDVDDNRSFIEAVATALAEKNE